MPESETQHPVNPKDIPTARIGLKYVISPKPSSYWQGLGWIEVADLKGDGFTYTPPPENRQPVQEPPIMRETIRARESSSSATIDAKVTDHKSDDAKILELTNKLTQEGELKYYLMRGIKYIFTLGYGFGFFSGRSLTKKSL